MNLLLLHGLGQTPESWGPTVRAIGAEALCPDLSRWLDGKSSYSGLYRGLEEYCAQLEGPLYLCGLSLGGVLALQYAIGHPDRVARLALASAQYAMPKGLLKFQNLLFRLMPERSFRGMGLGKQAAIALCGSMANLNFAGELGRVQCPALVICGEKDKANRRAAQGLKEGIPRAELAFIPHAGHEVNVDAPEILGERLKEFFVM